MFFYYLEGKDRMGKIVFAGVWTAFAVIWTFSFGILSYKSYRTLLEAYRSGNCHQVKGVITDAYQESRSRYKFKISDHSFELNERISTAGMNKHHPAIKDGATASIAFCEGEIAYMRVD